MADLKISALTASTTPLAGTEVLPIVQSSTTKQVSVANLTAGRVVSVGNLSIPNGTEGAPSIYAVGDATSGIYSSGASATSFSFAGKLAGEFTAASGYWNIYRRNATSQYLETSVTSAGANILVSAGAGVLNLGIGATSYLTISGAGDVSLPSTNLIQGTAAKGINFTANTPAAGMTSQLLNWYEEGSYTVTLFDAASGGNASATTATGRYTRVGNLVTCSFSGLNAISTAGMTAGNTLYISLPFTASSTGTGAGSFACENISFGVLRTNAIPVALNSNSRAIFRAYGSGTSSASLIVSNITSGSANIDYFTLTYRA
jgi:hypothetical protein